MHFLTSLIIFSGFVLALCLGLGQVILDLAEISFHVSPHVPETPHYRTAEVRVLIRDVSCRIERRFAAFAEVPFHDPPSRQQWEQLWESDHRTSAAPLTASPVQFPPRGT
jgi:hypothetical protein